MESMNLIKYKLEAEKISMENELEKIETFILDTEEVYRNSY